MPEKIEKLKWNKLSVYFQSRFKHLINFTVLQAIVKASYLKAFPDYKWHREGAAGTIFHAVDKRWNYQFNPDEKFLVEIILTDRSDADFHKFVESFISWMSIPVNCNYYSLSTIDKVETVKAEHLLDKYRNLYDKSELCIDFLTPYNKKNTPGKHPSYLSEQDFIDAYQRRFSRLFNTNFKYKSSEDDFKILSCYWQFNSIAKHKSKTQPGTYQDLKGYTGRLYIKGKFNDLLPFVVLGSELHGGNKLSFSYGYYQILEEDSGYFNDHFPEKKKLTKAVKDTVADPEFNIDMYKSLETPYTSDLSEVADDLIGELKSGEFCFFPSKLVEIPKKSGGEREIELFCFKDTVVNKYLNKIIQPVLERYFQPESIGFRKNTPRSRAVLLINKAISAEFVYIFESDIQDFFPSISHHILLNRLDLVFSEKDKLIKDLVVKSIQNKYIKKGKVIVREKGLSQGSSLSPILANLYLDSFDKFVKQQDVRLVRFADDFIVFTHTREQAEDIQKLIENYLETIELSLKQEKTFIKKLSDGFSFVGYNFFGMEVDENWISAVENIKKPLYITNPYSFLALDNETVCILDKNKPSLSIPLFRISEIILMEKISFSTSLIEACMDRTIPVVIAVKSGKYVAEIHYTSKKIFEIFSKHYQKFNNLDYEDKLRISKDLISGKFKNYLTFLKHRKTSDLKECIEMLEEKIEFLPETKSLDEIRGVEGAAARKIFQSYNSLINNENFYMNGRVRNNTDYINCLLNFGYYLLFSRINVTFRALGLNPYLGFLHSSKNRYESLVSDIVDLFRPKIDRLIIKLINLKRIDTDDFINTKKGYFLNSDGKKKFLNSYESEINKKSNKNNLSMSDNIYIQVHLIREWVMKNKKLSFYLWENT